MSNTIVTKINKLGITDINPLDTPVDMDIMLALTRHALATIHDGVLVTDFSKNSYSIPSRERFIGIIKSLEEGVHPAHFLGAGVVSYDYRVSEEGDVAMYLVLELYDIDIALTASKPAFPRKIVRPSIWEKAQGYNDIPLMRDTYIN